MSQTPDIVERLRETSWGRSVTDTLARWDAARADAADTIEALRSEVTDLQNTIARHEHRKELSHD